MRGSELLDKFAFVEDKYIDEAADVRPRRVRIGRLSAIAAACVLCVLAAVLVFTQLQTPVIIDENGFYIEDGVLKRYSGSETDVVFPEAVTAVADYAFRDNESRAAIATVTLGKNVKTVGANAFAGLDDLVDLVLEDENTAFVKRDGAIFTFDGSMLIRFEDKEATAYTLPDGTRYIAAHAFQSSKLTAVTFCDTLEYIGYNAFASCALTEINLPESIVRVEEGAFAFCTQAVDGYIPQTAELGQGAFDGVPFFLTQIAGHISPLEQIVRGQIMPAEAITLSDRAYLLGQLDAILAYYRDGREPSGDYGRISNIVGTPLPEDAVLPDAADFAALTFRDSGWGGTGIYDIELRLPLGDEVTLVAEAYLYGGAVDLLDWDDAPWRIETVTFLAKSAAGAESYGAWKVSAADNVLVFHNTETDAVARAELPLAGAFTYELTFSPGGNRVIVEYRQDGDWFFRIHSLDGDVFEPSGNTYADYMNRYFGRYTHGTLSWKNNDTVTGENEYGTFEFNPHELYPEQVTDYRRAFREDVLVDRVLLSEYGRREITDYVITVPETWVGDNYLEDIRRMETTPENAARMAGFYSLCDLYGRPDEPYRDGKWDLTALSLRGMLTTDGEVIENNAERIILRGRYAEREETWYSAAMLADSPPMVSGGKVLLCNFTVYPDDPADYFDRVIRPVIASFRAVTRPHYYTFTFGVQAADGEMVNVTLEGLRYVGGRTLATLSAEDGGTLVLDVTAAVPYDAAREGERLLAVDVQWEFFIEENGHLTSYRPDGDIDLGDISALYP
ncbi:MAG: leucine-rich repeat domain-containing protein [Clostridiales bacterium]|nr:leucine-rich repeat domain-containing protein [Clostridiales bacterium]